MDTLTLSLIAIFHKPDTDRCAKINPMVILKKKYRDIWMVKLRYI